MTLLICPCWVYFDLSLFFRSTPITARKPASRTVRHSDVGVTGVHKSASSKTAKVAKKGLTVRIERDSVSSVATGIETKRATTSRNVADTSIVDKLASWDKKNDQERSFAENARGELIIIGILIDFTLLI